MTDPGRQFLGLVQAYRLSACLFVAAELGIGDLLADGPRTSDQLADATGAQPQALRRLLRALVGMEVLAEDGVAFRLTPVGEELRSDRMRGAPRFFGAKTNWVSWSSLLHSVMTGERAFDHAHGMRNWDYYRQHPEAAARFDAGMRAITSNLAPAIAAAHDFSRFGVIIDVGGGDGTLLAEIVRRYPHVRGVLFDRPDVVERARQPTLEKVGGNFLERVPDGGDAYLMKSIIHDWEDEEAAVILRRCRDAMTHAARLLLVERVLPERITAESLEALMADIMMMAGPGGRERTEAEFRELLRAGGFELERVVPTGTFMSVLESSPAT
jgi:SAM-dependent methyltransferase